MQLHQNKYLKKVRTFLALFANTPFHPQWLINRTEDQRFIYTASECTGTVLDIGCSDQQLSGLLPSNTHYIGLDYWDTVLNRYETRPAIFGDAQYLPFERSSIDTVVLLEVLEHIPDPRKVFMEIDRVLRPDGKLIMSMPFIYPLHDSPFDFQRFTHHGLQNIAKEQKFKIVEHLPVGTSLATASLLMNLGLCYSVLKGVTAKSPLIVLSIFLPPLILILNCVGWLSEKTCSPDNFMPFGFTTILKK